MENPNLIFLMETRLKLEEVHNFKFKFVYDCFQVVECSSSGGKSRGSHFDVEGKAEDQ